MPTVVSAPALTEELEIPKQKQTQDLSWQSEKVLAQTGWDSDGPVSFISLIVNTFLFWTKRSVYNTS